MKVNNVILHVLDFNSHVSIFSQRCLEIDEKNIRMYIEKHIEHICFDINQKTGSFLSRSMFCGVLKKYLYDKMSFIELSNYIGNELYENILKSDKNDSLDVMIAEFLEKDIRYIAILLLKNKVAYTHQVINDDGEVYNEIIRHYAILPDTTQKIESYALIRCDTFEVKFRDKQRFIDGKDVYILPDVLLQCSTKASSKEVIKEMNIVVTKIADKHGANSVELVSKAKNYLLENAEISSRVSLLELGEEVFEKSEEMRVEFEKEVEELELPQNIHLEKKIAIRTNKKHKIKTDTGIEIVFPAEYFDNCDFIKFINNPDGTITIELNNIGKLQNKY